MISSQIFVFYIDIVHTGKYLRMEVIPYISLMQTYPQFKHRMYLKIDK